MLDKFSYPSPAEFPETMTALTRTTRVDLLAACSMNGVFTPARGARGLSSLGLIDDLAVPAEILELQATMRRRYDVVLVGPNTVLVDNPSLASHASPGHTCIRATLDPAGKIPGDYRFLDGAVRTIIGVSEATPSSYLSLLEERGVEAVSCGDTRVDLPHFFSALASKGLHDILVEGGGRLNRALLDQHLVDRLHLLLMPLVLTGGPEGAFDGSPHPLGQLKLAGCDHLGNYLLLHYEAARPL